MIKKVLRPLYHFLNIRSLANISWCLTLELILWLKLEARKTLLKALLNKIELASCVCHKMFFKSCLTNFQNQNLSLKNVHLKEERFSLHILKNLRHSYRRRTENKGSWPNNDSRMRPWRECSQWRLVSVPSFHRSWIPKRTIPRVQEVEAGPHQAEKVETPANSQTIIHRTKMKQTATLPPKMTLIRNHKLLKTFKSRLSPRIQNKKLEMTTWKTSWISEETK